MKPWLEAEIALRRPRRSTGFAYAHGREDEDEHGLSCTATRTRALEHRAAIVMTAVR